MDDRRGATGLLFQAVARARREAVERALFIHGFDELAVTALPYLLDGAAEPPEEGEMERLLRVCRVVDDKMLEGVESGERERLAACLRRMLENLNGAGALWR